MNRLSLFAALAAAMLILSIILGGMGCTTAPQAPNNIMPSTEETEAVPASPQTTDAPDEHVETVEERSRRAELLAAAEAILSGDMKAEEVEPFFIMQGMNGGQCFLKLSDDENEKGLVAYDVRTLTRRWKQAEGSAAHEYFSETYDCAEPFADFPLEAGREAKAKLAEYAAAYLNSHLTDEGTADTIPKEGFAGEDWFVLKTIDPSPKRYVHTIWRTDDGKNYYEFGNNNEGFLGDVIGACIVSDTTGFICQAEIKDEYCTFRVYGTFDGGAAWEDMGISVPDESDGMRLDSAAAFFPTFIGDRGLIFVSASYADHTDDSGRSLISTYCFITSDGGRTWERGE